MESCTLGTRDRSARNCSCVITSRPIEAEGLRNVTSPGGAGCCPLPDKPPAPCPAWRAEQNRTFSFLSAEGIQCGVFACVKRCSLGYVVLRHAVEIWQRVIDGGERALCAYPSLGFLKPETVAYIYLHFCVPYVEL